MLAESDEDEETNPRRARTGLRIALALAVAAGIAASVVALMDGEASLRDPADDEELGRRVPWDPGDGPTRRFSGRVVTPNAEPISGVEVQLVYPGDPHWEESVAYETTTSSEGRFAFDGVAALVQFRVVVRGQGGRRTFEPPHDPSAAELRAGDIRLAADYPVKISVRCTSTPRPTFSGLPGESEPPAVQVHWLPDQDLYLRFYPGLEGGTEEQRSYESQVMPGRQPSLLRVPLSARSFTHETRLPAGRFLVTVSGACGVAQREIEIRPGGAEPQVIEFEVPVQEHGSLHIEAPGTSDGVYVYLRQGPASVADPRVEPYRPARIERLAPGRYEVTSFDVGCQREIEIAPGSTVRLEVGPDSCRVTREPE